MSTFQPFDPQNQHTYGQNTTNNNQTPPNSGGGPSFTQGSQSPYTGFSYPFESHTSSFQPRPQAPKPIYQGIDTLFAWLSIIVGFLFVRTLPVVQNTLGGFLMTCLLFAFGACYLVYSKVKPGTASIVIAAVACFLSVGLITGANKTLQRLLFLFVILAFLYFIYSVCGLAGKNPLSQNCVAHAFHAIFTLPFGVLDALFRALPIRRRKESDGKLMRTLGWVLLGLAVAIIPTAVVILLLSYDEQFTNLLEQIFSFSLDGVWEYIRDIILGFLVAILLFGALFAVKWKRQRNNGEEMKTGTTNCHILPKALLCAAVTPILAVYVIFFISQWNYYLSAFTHTLPQDLTYAAYARSGFFELCWVSAINAAMLLLFNLLIRRKDGERGILQAIYSSLISLFTLVLIATALSKMVLYIGSYGLTQKRVYASWLMLLLAVIFIAVLLAQFIKKIRLVPVIVALCILFFGLVAIPDIDGMIASYNVNTYLAGDLNEVDVDTLAEYGVSSVPALVELRDELSKRSFLTVEESDIIQKAEKALDGIKKELSEQPNSFFTFNIPTARARALLKE